jgi:hypothetical protein
VARTNVAAGSTRRLGSLPLEIPPLRLPLPCGHHFPAAATPLRLQTSTHNPTTGAPAHAPHAFLTQPRPPGTRCVAAAGSLLATPEGGLMRPRLLHKAGKACAAPRETRTAKTPCNRPSRRAKPKAMRTLAERLCSFASRLCFALTAQAAADERICAHLAPAAMPCQSGCPIPCRRRPSHAHDGARERVTFRLQAIEECLCLRMPPRPYCYLSYAPKMERL